MEDATYEMQMVATVIEATSQPMSRRDPMRPYMDIIYAEVPQAPNPGVLLGWMHSVGVCLVCLFSGRGKEAIREGHTQSTTGWSSCAFGHLQPIFFDG